jgi:hypothetical protein
MGVLSSGRVATQDGHLIAIHTADLNVTTDVEAVMNLDQEEQITIILENLGSAPPIGDGYWSLTLRWREIKTLRVRQRLPRARTTAYDGMFPAPPSGNPTIGPELK